MTFRSWWSNTMILIAQTILLISPFPLHLYSHGDQETEDTERPCCTTVQRTLRARVVPLCREHWGPVLYHCAENREGPCCTTVQTAWSKLILHIIEQTDSVCVYTDWQVNIFLLISPRELPLTGRFRSRILPWLQQSLQQCTVDIFLTGTLYITTKTID